MAQNKKITVNLGTAITDTNIVAITKASSSFGGMTIVRSNVVVRGAGTTDAVLMNYGVSGTVAGGTVAGILGGSAALVAATPTALAITAANAFLDADEWLYYVSDGGTTPADTILEIEYVDGVVTQG